MDPDGGTTRLGAAAFGVLLLATVGAFFLANQLKSQPPEIEIIKRYTFFSPNGDGDHDTNPIVFSVGESGSAAVDIVDADGVRVRRITDEKPLRKDVRTRVTWDGRTDDGERAPDGEYQMRLILEQGRSLLAPRPFFVDTEPPVAQVEVDEATPIVRPGTPVDFVARGTGGDRAPRFRVVRTDVDPPEVVRTIEGELGRHNYTWDGMTDTASAAPAGTYLIAVSAFDFAGNRGDTPKLPLGGGSVPGRPGVTVRELAVQPPVRSVRAGDPVNVRVDARGRAFRWALTRAGERKPVLTGRKDAGASSVLLRAPSGGSGLYLMRVAHDDVSTTVPIVVRARATAPLLVVVPMISWLGRDPVDQTGDGVPDVFGGGEAVRFPRLFTYPGGLPPSLRHDLVPLIAAIEARGIDYRLVTDLDLAFGAQPTAEQTGVLFAGEPTWTSRELSRRLRDYVTAGGRVALFGPRALRATVSVADAVLARPSPVTDVDALGGRIGEVRDLGGKLTVLDEDPALGLLEGFSGTLRDVSSVEELLSPGPGRVTTSVGEETTKLRPAISAAEQGKGVVIRVGLPGWGPRLRDGDGPVGQLTANIVDILRGAEPKARTARG